MHTKQAVYPEDKKNIIPADLFLARVSIGDFKSNLRGFKKILPQLKFAHSSNASS
ncbi:hypothetical protein [Helicobacter mesocricetorum]|uniref:hypothetical protein n=1 Tax=Helicobacter mesocricetorum TaxID=87012 RepID=UPI0013155134|nr:hypothetical protein [Helicobacter mesocricetorum]